MTTPVEERAALDGGPFGGDWLPVEEVVRPFGETRRGVTFLDGSTTRSCSYQELASWAAVVAGRLRDAGLRPGDRAAVTIGNDLDSVLTAMAIWAVGAAVISLPPASHRAAPWYGRHFGAVLRRAGCVLVIADPGDDGAAPATAGEGLRMLLKSVLCSGLDAAPAPPPDPGAGLDGAALIQFTSGSVSQPKGVEISARTLGRHLAAISAELETDPARDRVVSWLPLYHDMGLLTMFFAALATRTDLVLMPPSTFAHGPARWLTVLGRQRGTITAAPNFAYKMAAIAPYPDDLDLSGVRVCLSGGERINWQTLTDFHAATERLGFSWGAIMPSYGLAEAVVGTTTTPLGRGPAQGPGGHISVGRPITGIRVEAPSGLPAGPVSLRGEWLLDGYHTADGFLPVGRQEPFDTGDHGFIHGGELFVLGRRSEVIAVAGRNVFAEDIEAAVHEAHGTEIRACAAFRLKADDGQFGVMVEVPVRPKRDPAEIASFGARVRSAVAATVGVRVHAVLMVRPGTIPRTSSGKVQRAQCRELHATDDLKHRLLAAVG